MLAHGTMKDDKMKSLLVTGGAGFIGANFATVGRKPIHKISLWSSIF